MSEVEVRTYPVGELRFVADPEKPRIEGRAIVYDALSEDLGGWRERFAPGSVRLSDDLLALFDHDTSMVLGRTSAGTLEAEDGADGVDMTAYLPETQWARDLRVSMERGDIRHMSFRFIAEDDEWESLGDQVVRTVLEAEVLELSVVSMPAYPQTSAQARTRAQELRGAAAGDAAPTMPENQDQEAGAAAGSQAPGAGARLYIVGGRLITFPDSEKEA